VVNFNFIIRVSAKVLMSLFLISLIHGTLPKPEEIIFVILQSEIHKQLDKNLK